MPGFIGEVRRTGNSLLLRVCAIAAIGGLLFGYDTGVISGALLFIKSDLHATDFEQEAIVAAVLLGAMVGAAASGYLADRISRRYTKVASGVVYLVAALGCALSVNAPMLIGFRLLLGLAVGTASFVSPLYIAEMAPPKIRGGLVSFNQLAITSGILLAYVTNFLLQNVAGDWRWMLGAAALPGAALAVGMLSVPQTPRWLVNADRPDDAREVLRTLRSGDPHADIEAEFDDISDANAREQKATIRDLFAPKIRPMLVIGTVLALAQQLVGVNTVIYYAPTVLAGTGLSNSASLARTVVVGVTNLVFTVIAVLLLDRVGRRKLLITGTVGIISGLTILAVYFSSSWLQDRAGYLALVGLLVFIASFGVGLGPVFWLLISEIFPIGVRSAGMAMCTVVNWGANFLVAQTFLTLSGVITRQGVFYLYAGLAVASLAFFVAKVPETRGRSLEQVQADLTDQAHR
ncbi:sugar porter family MFS transporter [Mycolicibacterium sp.]|uniref:sugar porter family MFS transporter n=1 Tax=Mycolicibacterium sp. TaxID=2320850 RepID=UPI0037C88B0C